MCSLCRLLLAKKHNFWQILTFWGLMYRPPLTDAGRIWCAIADPRYTFVKFHLDRFILSPSVVEKPQFLPFFGLRHLVLSPIGSSLRKLNRGAQLQTFPYPTAFKIVSVLQRLHGEIWRTISDVRKRDEQTDKQCRQTDKKAQRFWPLRRRVKSEPHQA